LTEAEGVADIIEAETNAQKAQALRQLTGGLTEQYDRWRAELTGILALIEVAVDFPDEDDAPDETTQPVVRKLNDLIEDIEAALGDRGIGEKIRDGFRIAIIGAPNAGKSTLLNRLAGRDAAIVTSRPGTTRDVIEVRRIIGGQVVWLSDTAGLRETDDEIEAEGVRRAERVAAEADLRLFMVDGSAPETGVLSSPFRQPTDMVVVNKVDETPAPALPEFDHRISARDGDGVPELEAAIADFISRKAASVEAPVITRARHRARLVDGLSCLIAAREALTLGTGPELAAEDVRLAIRHLGAVVGAVGVEDVLGAVFSQFCIGK
ncbi:MAG: GTPase, partial [Hyphomonas sp.]|nr:GTPase [Hyphomonas sp.]